MPKRISRSEAEAWLATNCPRYRILSWPEKAGDKCLFVDDLRGVEFYSTMPILKRNIKRNPSCIFSAKPGEHSGHVSQGSLAAAKEKRKQTNLERYGHENPFIFARDKISKTNLEKYGSESPFSDSVVRQKAKKAIIERYGFAKNFSSRQFSDQANSTMIQRYGENPLSSESIRQKARQTFLEKYGTDNPAKNVAVKNKTKNTCLQKYGVDHVFKSAKVRDKAFCTKVSRGNISLINGKTISEIAAQKGLSYTNLKKIQRQLGDDAVLNSSKQMTAIELVISTILQKNNIEFIHNKSLSFTDGSIRPDFYLPDSKLVIECDGLYWHSEVFYDKRKSTNKKAFYDSAGLTSLFFYEDEIVNCSNVVESIILNKAKKNNVTYSARDKQFCLRKIKSKDAKSFLDSNHIMGAGSGDCYCVFSGDNILSCMQIARKGDGISISRFCSRTFCSVRGAFGKLLKLAINDTNPAFVETFIDQRYGTGSYLPSFGFELKTCYPSFYWTDFERRFHRLNFRGNTGYEAGLVKIWDCGQAKWVKKIS